MLLVTGGASGTGTGRELPGTEVSLLRVKYLNLDLTGMFKTLKLEICKPGGRLFQWQRTRVEGGGGRTASFSTILATNDLSRPNSLCQWRLHIASPQWPDQTRLWLPDLDSVLGSCDGVLAACGRSGCCESRPCSRRRSKINYCYVLQTKELNLIRQTMAFDTL